MVSVGCCKNSYCFCNGDGDGDLDECNGEGAYFCGDEWLDPTNPPSTTCRGGGECSPDDCFQGSTSDPPSTTPPTNPSTTTPEPKDCWEVCEGTEAQVMIEDFFCSLHYCRCEHGYGLCSYCAEGEGFCSKTERCSDGGCSAETCCDDPHPPHLLPQQVLHQSQRIAGKCAKG